MQTQQGLVWTKEPDGGGSGAGATDAGGSAHSTVRTAIADTSRAQTVTCVQKHAHTCEKRPRLITATSVRCREVQRRWCMCCRHPQPRAHVIQIKKINKKNSDYITAVHVCSAPFPTLHTRTCANDMCCQGPDGNTGAGQAEASQSAAAAEMFPHVAVSCEWIACRHGAGCHCTQHSVGWSSPPQPLTSWLADSASSASSVTAELANMSVSWPTCQQTDTANRDVLHVTHAGCRVRTILHIM